MLKWKILSTNAWRRHLRVAQVCYMKIIFNAHSNLLMPRAVGLSSVISITQALLGGQTRLWIVDVVSCDIDE